MNLDELLDRWRCGELGHADLAQLTRQLATREGRARLRQDWLLEVSLPAALQAATLRQAAPTSRPSWLDAWRGARIPWHLAWRWGAGLAALAIIVGLLGQLKPRVASEPNTPPPTTSAASVSLASRTEDLRDLALIVGKPPVLVLDSPQAAWLSVLNSMTEDQNP